MHAVDRAGMEDAAPVPPRRPAAARGEPQPALGDIDSNTFSHLMCSRSKEVCSRFPNALPSSAKQEARNRKGRINFQMYVSSCSAGRYYL